MWILNTEGDQIVRLFGKRSNSARQGAEQRDRLPSSITGKGSYAVWADAAAPEDDLPVLIIVAPGEVRGFVAWASTYLGSYRPFTGFCRVIDASQAKSIDGLKTTPSLGKIADASVAIVITEALTHGRGRVDLKALTLPICLTTFSFAAARCLALGFAESGLETVARNLTMARGIMQQPVRHPTPPDIHVIWHVLSGQPTTLGPKREGSLFSEAVAIHPDVINKGGFGEEAVRALSNGAIALPALMKEMEAPREARVSTFERSVAVLTGSQLRNRVASEALAGYIASLLSPGTFEYVDLVSSFSDRLPSLLLWYGLFTGIHPGSTVLWEHGGLGRKLLREILSPDNIVSPPRCDIAVDELTVLTERTSAFEFYRQSRQSSLYVEVFPMINVVVPAASRTRLDNAESAADVDSWRKLGWLLDEIGVIFRRLSPKEQPRETKPADRGKERKRKK
jgi:hypothetical protein